MSPRTRAFPRSVTDPVATLPLYTNLFMKLGIVAVLGTVIAAALIPTMKKLSAVSEGPWEDAAGDTVTA